MSNLTDRIQHLAERFACKHQRTCALIRAWILIALMAFGAGSAGYYLNDIKNNKYIDRMESAFSQVLAERDARLEILERFCPKP